MFMLLFLSKLNDSSLHVVLPSLTVILMIKNIISWCFYLNFSSHLLCFFICSSRSIVLDLNWYSKFETTLWFLTPCLCIDAFEWYLIRRWCESADPRLSAFPIAVKSVLGCQKRRMKPLLLLRRVCRVAPAAHFQVDEVVMPSEGMIIVHC